jgi:hypothetical protein
VRRRLTHLVGRASPAPAARSPQAP